MNKFKRLNGAAKASAVVAVTLIMTCALVLLAAEKAERGFLGVSVKSLGEEERGKIGVSHGVQVLAVEKESAAAKAGIQKGDVIQAVNGEKIRDPQALAEVVRELAPGSMAKIGLWRAGKALEVKAALGKFEPSEHFIWSGVPMTKVIRSKAYLGVNLLELNADLAAYFSVPAGQGVLVTAVEKGTPAEKAGIKAGDIVVQMGERVVKESQDIHEALASLKEGDGIVITVVRHGKRETLKAEPDFSRQQRILRIFKGGKDLAIDHLELPDLDVMIPEPPEPPDMQEIERHVDEAMEHAHEKLDQAHEKLDQAKVKIEKRLRRSSENIWI